MDLVFYWYSSWCWETNDLGLFYKYEGMIEKILDKELIKNNLNKETKECNLKNVSILIYFYNTKLSKNHLIF